MPDDFPFTQLSFQLLLVHTCDRDFKKCCSSWGLGIFIGIFMQIYIAALSALVSHLCFVLSAVGFGWNLLDCRFWPLLWTKVLLIHQRRFRNGNLQGFVLASKF